MRSAGGRRGGKVQVHVKGLADVCTEFKSERTPAGSVNVIVRIQHENVQLRERSSLSISQSDA